MNKKVPGPKIFFWHDIRSQNSSQIFQKSIQRTRLQCALCTKLFCFKPAKSSYSSARPYFILAGTPAPRCLLTVVPVMCSYEHRTGRLKATEIYPHDVCTRSVFACWSLRLQLPCILLIWGRIYRLYRVRSGLHSRTEECQTEESHRSSFLENLVLFLETLATKLLALEVLYECFIANCCCCFPFQQEIFLCPIYKSFSIS